MICKIDQSGKVEDTGKLTVVCFANGKIKTLLITAKEKRKLLIAMREIEKPKKTFVFKIFAGLIFLLIQHENIETIIIDEEYPEHEATIKFILLNLFQKFRKQKPNIYFCRIGKNSIAHTGGISVFRGENKPNMEARAKDILGLFYGKT